jgi:beta-lactamase superfamily II metal-dependent hydrolase
MKLRIFQGANGDCVLVESTGGKFILCDGGMPGSMEHTVLEALDALRQQGVVIDLLYVSHIDQDHIGGVLKLLEAETKWRVYDHHQNAGDNDFRPPKEARPPPIKAIWHNAFRDQVEDNEGHIEDLLAASAPVLLATQAGPLFEIGLEMQEISLGVEQAMRVSKLVGPDILDIPVNRLPGAAAPAKLLMARANQGSVQIGDLDIFIVGPTERELEQLRKGWNHWVENNEDKITKVNEQIRRRMEEFSSSEQPPQLDAAVWEAFAAREWEGQPGFRGVTVPNIASVVLFVREGNRTLLLTGDAQHDILLKHLKEAGRMPDGHLHVDVLKVQHHGSENNMSPRFAREVSADHYVFCGNGASDNPEVDVIKQVYASRMSTNPAVKALSPQAAENNRKFHFWFSTSVATPSGAPTYDEAFKKTADRAIALEAKSGGRLEVHFNESVFTTLNVP